MIKLVDILIGKVKEYEIDDKKFSSAYKKKSCDSVKVLKDGLVGDEQADKKHHGGIDKAILIYSLKNYEKCRHKLNKPLEYNSFGENFVVSGLNEINVFLGDIYKIGEVIIQITQPRQPCFKISKLYDKTLFNFVVQNHATGFYAKVLNEGSIKRGVEIELLERKSDISIEKSTKILNSPQEYLNLIDKLLGMDFLADSYKEDLKKRL